MLEYKLGILGSEDMKGIKGLHWKTNERILGPGGVVFSKLLWNDYSG